MSPSKQADIAPAAIEADAQYSASWAEPGPPPKSCGVSANANGVNFWESWGPGPDDGYGRSYNWAEWFKNGSAGGGGPADLLTRIDAVGRYLGHARPTPRLVRRADLQVDPDLARATLRQQARAHQREAQHRTRETLQISAAALRRVRTLALDHAATLWELVRPGKPLQARVPAVSRDGTLTVSRTDLVDAGGVLAYALVETEDRWQMEGTQRVWHQLRIQAGSVPDARIELWFVDGLCQIEVTVDSEARVNQIGAALERQHPRLHRSTKLCGAVRAFVQHAGGSTMHQSWFGAGPPTRVEVPAHAGGADPGEPTELRCWPAKVKRVLQFAFDAKPALIDQAQRSGLFWVVPVGTTTFGCWIGVRRLPGLPLAQCPVALCHGSNVATIATELRDSLAILLWWLGPRSDPAKFEQLQREWGKLEEQVELCAAGIGGNGAVRRFREWLDEDHDPDLDLPANSPKYLQAVARVSSRLDPLQAGFRTNVVALAAGLPEPVAEVPVAWQAALVATRYAAKPGNPELAWAAACAMPALDTGCRLGVGHFVNVKNDWHSGSAELAARVALRVPREGPNARALASLLEQRQAGGRDAGLAHLAAAREAQDAGDYAAAWTLLAAAGFWSSQRGHALPGVGAAAAEIAEQAGFGALDSQGVSTLQIPA